MTEIINDLLVENPVRREKQPVKAKLKSLPFWSAGVPQVNIAVRNALYYLLGQDDEYVDGR